jgi:hypothetical protein
MEPASDIKYKRLTRAAGVSLVSRGSLWLAPDHVLAIESNGYTETYKRFYFRDVQAILIHKTKRFEIVNFVLGIIALAFLLLTIFTMPKSASEWHNSDTIVGGVLLGLITGIALVFFLVNLIAGRTCKTFLRTAVQIEYLPSLARVRATRRALAKIHPLIVAAQGGELSAEAVSAQMREWSEPASKFAPSEIAENDPNIPPRLDS